MKRRILALSISAMIAVSAIAGLVVSAADGNYINPLDATTSDEVLSDANLLYAAGADVSFENGTVGEMAAGYVSNNNLSGTIADDKCKFGSNSMLVTDGWKSANGTYEIALSANKYYELSFWYYCEPGEANSTLILKNQDGVAIKDVEGKCAPDAEPIWYSGSPDGVWAATNCGEWKYVERIIYLESDVTSLTFSFNGAGISNYDDLCIMEIGETLPTPVVTPTPEPTPTPTATPTPSVSPSESASPTVTDEPSNPVKKSVKFKKKSVKIKKGKKVTLKVTIKGAKKAAFSVDKKGKKVVKLSKKKAKSVVVKGKKKGTAKVVAKVGNKKDTCKVKVK